MVRNSKKLFKSPFHDSFEGYLFQALEDLDVARGGRGARHADGHAAVRERLAGVVARRHRREEVDGDGGGGARRPRG